MLSDRCLCLMCADYGDRDRLDATDAGLAADTGEHGWAVRAIPDDDLGAGWAYTVGLWHTFRSPEVAVFGLPPDVGMRLANSVGDQVAAGRQVAADDVLDDVLEGGYQVALRPVDDSWRPVFFGMSMGFYRSTRGVRYLQALWPDRAGNYPGDPGFRLDDRQPRLWLPREDHPPGPWTELD